MKEKIIIYTDGGSRGNPGIAGAGAFITDSAGKVLKEVSQYLGKGTNNFAEYEAVILGLQTLKKLFSKDKLKELDIEVKLDSQLIARQLSGEYQVKEETLFGQFIKVHNMQVKDFPKIMFTYIPREQNKEADRLANEAMDSA
ncbi:ribonuclease HI family protein [bacterium]|nr:ribonuclease HI family protein [bacterium]MBT3730207.1 ribonuclease HI family protein [bacterium]MBT4894756.1 ribonuclease HI family protein [bacterium]